MSPAKKKRARGPSGNSRARATIGTFRNAPVYDGHVVTPVTNPLVGDDVMLGIGPAGEWPVAYLLLCPTSGVSNLVGDLIDVASVQGPIHVRRGEDP